MKKIKWAAILILLLFFSILIFIFTPNLSPFYAEGLSFWAIAVTIIALVLWIVNSAAKNEDWGGLKFVGKPGKIYLTAAVVPWALLILTGVFSSVFFHVSAYRGQMPQPETRKFTSDVQPIDVSQLPIVDYDLAKRLADKKLGEKPALGSQVTLGEPTIQKVDGHLEWVVPLEHSGFFKWLSNSGGTPGYIVVSATNPHDVTYVNKYPIKYQPKAYLLENLKRHTRFSGGMFTGLTDYSFELDDSGRSYWVVTVYRNRAGFSLPEATGVLVVDAGTGKTARYSIGSVPGWVDRVQPAEFLTAQLNNRGKYIHGIFNFSNKDKFQTSEGYAIVYNNNRCYYFTGLTSIGSDESATGFVMVDMVTKKPYLYNIGGATEYAAQKSAEGKVQNYKYSASFPLITNVDGEVVYFMTLKDDTGLIKQYAFVSMRDYTTVGTGETVSDALDDFRRNLRNFSNANSVINAGSDRAALEGTVSRIASEQENGSTVYKFILQEQPDILFTATYDVSEELALTRAGDKVKIEYDKSDKSVVPARSFANEMITLK